MGLGVDVSVSVIAGVAVIVWVVRGNVGVGVGLDVDVDVAASGGTCLARCPWRCWDVSEAYVCESVKHWMVNHAQGCACELRTLK